MRRRRSAALAGTVALPQRAVLLDERIGGEAVETPQVLQCGVMQQARQAALDDVVVPEFGQAEETFGRVRKVRPG